MYRLSISRSCMALQTFDMATVMRHPQFAMLLCGGHRLEFRKSPGPPDGQDCRPDKTKSAVQYW